MYRTQTEHNFVIGNYRLVGHASNYGYIQVRHDESVPEWIGDASAEHPSTPFLTNSSQFGMGWGFLLDLADNATVLSTFYDGNNSADSFERSFGMGYARKVVMKGGLAVQQDNVVPLAMAPS